jgi:hypothetical protein
MSNITPKYNLNSSYNETNACYFPYKPKDTKSDKPRLLEYENSVILNRKSHLKSNINIPVQLLAFYFTAEIEVLMLPQEI